MKVGLRGRRLDCGEEGLMSIFAYPVKLKDDGEIVIENNRALRQTLKIGV